MNRAHRPPADGLVNVGLGLLAATAVLAELLRLAGTLAAWASGADQPDVGVAAALGVLADPLDPATALDAPGLHPIVSVARCHTAARRARGRRLGRLANGDGPDQAGGSAAVGRYSHDRRHRPDRLCQDAVQACRHATAVAHQWLPHISRSAMDAASRDCLGWGVIKRRACGTRARGRWRNRSARDSTA
jgi:hypothetical protein